MCVCEKERETDGEGIDGGKTGSVIVGLAGLKTCVEELDRAR